LQELKSRAADLTSRVTPERRGYFTPDEEEATLGLLVSYWHTRNALFDLICTLRQEYAGQDPPRTAFLVGFSGAALLVDAARFLRETAAVRPIVRAKLNEAAPQFQIPAGVYDRIQKSLVSTRNGWHLLEAIRRYRQWRDEPGSELPPEFQLLVEIIDQLLPRLDVSVSDFARAKLRTRAGQISRRVGRLVLGRTMYGLQRFAGTLAADKYLRLGHRPRLPVEVAAEVRSLLLPGDVLVVRKEYALTNYFLPGYWPHAALYLGTSSQLEHLGIPGKVPTRVADLARGGNGVVLESMRDGVQLRTLQSPFSVDSVVVLRPKLTRDEIARGLIRVLAHEGKPYDFDFDFRRSDRLVCTEVVYRAYDGIGGLAFPLIRRAGRPTLAGRDLIRHALHGELFDLAAAFAPRLMPGVRRADDALAVLRAGHADEDQPSSACRS
jgi:hypothetical protein